MTTWTSRSCLVRTRCTTSQERVVASFREHPRSWRRTGSVGSPRFSLLKHKHLCTTVSTSSNSSENYNCRISTFMITDHLLRSLHCANCFSIAQSVHRSFRLWTVLTTISLTCGISGSWSRVIVPHLEHPSLSHVTCTCHVRNVLRTLWYIRSCLRTLPERLPLCWSSGFRRQHCHMISLWEMRSSVRHITGTSTFLSAPLCRRNDTESASRATANGANANVLNTTCTAEFVRRAPPENWTRFVSDSESFISPHSKKRFLWRWVATSLDFVTLRLG